MRPSRLSLELGVLLEINKASRLLEGVERKPVEDAKTVLDQLFHRLLRGEEVSGFPRIR
jgi:hypothetical protein